MFEKNYQLAENPPPAQNMDEYRTKTINEYKVLLETSAGDEKTFQRFFEKNPMMIPGAFELIGTSGHYPYVQTLIAEPELNAPLFKKYPDFIWLAQDSLNFTPVLIEIERPNKTVFNQNGTVNANFTQALGQIQDWKATLNTPLNAMIFYESFNIPQYMRDKKFAPQYGLIYGRRAEYENDKTLMRKRAELTPSDTVLISYDRLLNRPLSECEDLLCCKLSHGNYNVITIPSTFRYSPCNAENLTLIHGFRNAISCIESISHDRKDFLTDRYEYWLEFGQKNHKGIMNSGDRE